MNISKQIISSHLLEGKMTPNTEILLKIDQTLCQDATGTLVMLELEAMNIDKIQVELSAQYVDHNLIQADFKNPDDHLFLESASKRFGLHFSRAGNGISHPVHMNYFGIPGKTLIGSDSHTCAGGAIGMLSIGAGGLDVARAMAGYGFYVKMPKIWGIYLSGKLKAWVSAKDVILELLRRYDVKGGLGYILEYYGPGVKNLSVMDRHVIANMGAELGATTSVFPSDEITREYYKNIDRLHEWTEMTVNDNTAYDRHEDLDLSTIEPMIALPSSPGNVCKVSEVEGRDIYQSYIGSSANPGYRDYAISAYIVEGKTVSNQVSLDINPSSRDILEELTRDGYLQSLIHSGARIHQAGCNGCIGMGQAPATGRISLRTVPRNFIGRSGTQEDSVYLCSPETAAASALYGKITDPRNLDMPYPSIKSPAKRIINKTCMVLPCSDEDRAATKLIKGPNIKSLPTIEPLNDSNTYDISLIVKDNISTDDISPAGSRVLPFRSNIPKLSEFCYKGVDPNFVERAQQMHSTNGGHIIIGGNNYGQGSSREHAALTIRYLGVHIIIAKSFARIHMQNLVNFGILPLILTNNEDYNYLTYDTKLLVNNIFNQLLQTSIQVVVLPEERIINLTHSLSARQIKLLQSGGLINYIANEQKNK